MERFDIGGDNWGVVFRTDGLGEFCNYEEAQTKIQTLETRVEELEMAVEEKEGAMHQRIRQGYDTAVANSWKAKVDELERALNGVRELMGEEHSYWACYPAQGPHNAVLRDYTKAWCKLIDRLIEGETFEEFTLVDEVDKYFKKEQHR